MEIDFEKSGGLVPAVVQDCSSGAVLMLGYMNCEALEKTRELGCVTFFSRSKGRLWTKGETSGNFLKVKEIKTDCDGDTLLIKAEPMGPACHTGQDTCFGDLDEAGPGFLAKLERLLADRKVNRPAGSYTSKLFEEGINRIAQKVGEEAVEVVIASKDGSKDRIVSESADLIFHLLVLLAESGISLADVSAELKRRHK